MLGPSSYEASRWHRATRAQQSSLLEPLRAPRPSIVQTLGEIESGSGGRYIWVKTLTVQ